MPITSTLAEAASPLIFVWSLYHRAYGNSDTRHVQGKKVKLPSPLPRLPSYAPLPATTFAMSSSAHPGPDWLAIYTLKNSSGFQGNQALSISIRRGHAPSGVNSFVSTASRPRIPGAEPHLRAQPPTPVLPPSFLPGHAPRYKDDEVD